MRRRVRRQVRIVVAVGGATLLLFAACGGGSSEEVPAPLAEPYAPVRQDIGPRSDSSTSAISDDEGTSPPPATPLISPPPHSDEAAPEAAPSPRALEEAPEATPEPAPIPISLSATVVEDGAALRAGPTQLWAVRETLAAGETVEITGRHHEVSGKDELPPHWLKGSTVEGVQGWIEITSLDLTREDAAELAVERVERVIARALIDRLHYRGDPGLDGKVRGQLQRGSEIPVRGRSPDGQWVLVLVHEGDMGIGAGWVYAANPDWLEVSAPVRELPVTLGWGLFVLALPQGPGDSVGDPVRIPGGSDIWFPDEPRLIYSQRTESGVLVRAYDARTGEHTDLFFGDGRPFSISPDGRYLVTLSRHDDDYKLHVQLRDWAGLVLAEASLDPCQCDSDFPTSRNIQWAPDGSALLVWDSEHLPRWVGNQRMGPISILRPGGNLEEIGVGSAATWTPDGAVVYVDAEGLVWRWESGSLSALRGVDGDRSVRVSADGQWRLFYSKSSPDAAGYPWQVDISLVHLETGRIVPLTRSFIDGGVSISDDGGFLAITSLPGA